MQKTEYISDKIEETDKRGENLIYNSQYSFAKFKDEFREISLDSMHKRLQDFHYRFDGLKKAKKNKDQKQKVLEDAGHLFQWFVLSVQRKIWRKKR